MSRNFRSRTEIYFDYGNEKLTKDFLKERIMELDETLKNGEACDVLLTRKNLELNSRIYEDCFKSN